MPWVLSKGSISWNGISEEVDGLRMILNSTVPSASTIDTITYQQFASLLGVQVGDQLTFIFAPQRSDIDESSCTEIIVSRLILSPYTGDPAETQIFDQNGHVINGNPLNENVSTMRFGVNSGAKFDVVQDAPDADVPTIGVACIVSRRNSSGAWLRSNASLVFDERQNEGGYTLRQASMVVNTEIVAPSDWYLNNANIATTSE